MSGLRNRYTGIISRKPSGNTVALVSNCEERSLGKREIGERDTIVCGRDDRIVMRGGKCDEFVCVDGGDRHPKDRAHRRADHLGVMRLDGFARKNCVANPKNLGGPKQGSRIAGIGNAGEDDCGLARFEQGGERRDFEREDGENSGRCLHIGEARHAAIIDDKEPFRPKQRRSVAQRPEAALGDVDGARFAARGGRLVEHRRAFDGEETLIAPTGLRAQRADVFEDRRVATERRSVHARRPSPSTVREPCAVASHGETKGSVDSGGDDCCVNARILEIAFLVIIALLVLVGGEALLITVSHSHGIAISVLGVVAIVIVYAFRRNFLAGGPQVRLNAARDGAFLAAILCAIAFVIFPAKWSLGATKFALEVGIVVEMLARLAPTRL